MGAVHGDRALQMRWSDGEETVQGRGNRALKELCNDRSMRWLIFALGKEPRCEEGAVTEQSLQRTVSRAQGSSTA